MTTPEIPAKDPSLSNLMDNGSLMSEPHSTPTKSNEQAAVKQQRPRPPIAPKPKGLIIKPVVRQRAATMSILADKEPPSEHQQQQQQQLKPPVTPRKLRTPPPKPPRQSLSDFPQVSCGSDKTAGSSDTSSSEFCDDEYDLIPDQSSISQPAKIPGQLGPLTTSHRHAGRAMSNPQLSKPQARRHSRKFDPILTPNSAPIKTDVIDQYHKTQAKHLPLFKGMTLAELAKKYAKFFPIKIQVTEGHYGASSKYSISTDDRFNLHFKKHMKQVTVQSYGEEYFVPLSTSIQFGVVYDPSNNVTVALEGHRFRRVADLIDTNPLPRVVRAISPCSCSNGVFLEGNELLVVKKVKKTHLFRGKPMLKVFSLDTMTKKLLPEEAIGNFTTKPLCLKMDLTQFMEHIPKPFPCKVMMYVDREEEDVDNSDEEELPPNLFSWPVTLKEVKQHESLVATLEKSSQLIDIPLQGNIAAVKANIVPPNSPEDIHELFRNTRTFLHQFDVTQVDIYGDFSTESVYDTQNTLYRMVRSSVKGLGVELLTPEALRKLQRQHQQRDDNFDADSFTSSTSGDPMYASLPGAGDSDDDYQTLDQVRPTAVATGADALENQPLVIDRTAPIPTPRVKPLVSPRARADTTFSGSGTFRYQQTPPPSTPLQKNHRSISLVHLPTSQESLMEENREYLKTLSIAQVYTHTEVYLHTSSADYGLLISDLHKSLLCHSTAVEGCLCLVLYCVGDLNPLPADLLW